MDMIETVVSDSAAKLAFLQAGGFALCPQGVLSQKAAPYTIICQVTRGRYKLSSGGRTVITNPPEAWITPANQELRAWHYGDAEHGGEMRVQFVHCHFVLYEAIALTDLLAMPAKTTPEVGLQLIEPIAELVKLQDMPRTLGCVTRRQSLAWQVLEIIFSISRVKPDAKEKLKAIQRLRSLLEYLQNNLADTISVDDMAGRTHLSPSRFHAVFRKSMGMSPLQYLKKLRLDKAAMLLQTSDANVAEISREVGFKSQFHLSREFRNHTGLPPLKYRKSIEEF